MSIFSAFRDYEAKRRPAPPVPGGDRAWTPLFVETFEQRKAVMARLRETYPQVFNPVEAPPDETPMQRVERVSAAAIAAKISFSDAMMRKLFGPPPTPAPGSRPEPPPPTQADIDGMRR